MSQFEIVFWKTIAAGERHFHITEATGQLIKARTMEWTENYPRKLILQLDNKTTSVDDNLLSVTFDGWDAQEGPLDVGDRVDYYVYPTSAPTTKTRVFWGVITELSQTSNGVLNVVAKDLLEKYEYIQPNTIVYANYRDQEQKDTTEYVGTRTIDGVTETGIALPPVFIGVATTDVRRTLSGVGANLDPLMTCTPGGGAPPDVYEFWSNAQAFVAEGDGVIGIQYYYQSTDIAVNGHIKCAIQSDVGGLPSGVDLASSEYLVGIGTNVNTPVQIDFTDAASKTIPIEKGLPYWVVFTCDDTIMCTDETAGGVYIIYHTGVAAAPYTDHFRYKELPAGAWTESAADRNLTVRLDFADYQELSSEDYYYDEAGDRFIVRSNGVPITTVDAYYSFYRGKVSFYYGTITTYDVFTKLFGFDPDMTGVTDASCDTTFTLYLTRGKSVAECFRELGDTFETTGVYDGYQHSVGVYRTAGGVDTVHAGFRPYSGGRTFSHGADSVVDDEIRIVSVNLKRTTTLRPASVIVIGKAATGAPVIVQRDDRALGTSSFRTKSKLALTTSHTDEAINTVEDASRKAYQILDSFTRGTWEGTITVAGVFPDLFDLTEASVTYAAGGHIHLNYSPLGIVNEQFHVKGIILHENTTEIQISNEDLLMLNALTDARGRAERSESFVASDDPFTTTFVSGYCAFVEDAATMYMQLCTADDVIINDGARVLCTRIANTRYNTVTYHAEFETDNGHTIDGTNHIMQLELWSTASGGVNHATVALPDSEHFPKWRTTRVIAEMHCKAA